MRSFVCIYVTSDVIRARGDHDAPRFFGLSVVFFAADQTVSRTTTVIIGAVSAVVAAMIISGGAWAFKKMKRDAVASGIEDFLAEDTPSIKSTTT